MRVGFDVGWTSKGLRASTIKIYDLYQDDIVLERGDVPSYSSEAEVLAADHPISRYRPQEIHETAEPPTSPAPFPASAAIAGTKIARARPSRYSASETRTKPGNS